MRSCPGQPAALSHPEHRAAPRRRPRRRPQRGAWLALWLGLAALAVALLVGWPLPSRGQTPAPPAAATDSTNREWLLRIERYLDAVRTLRSGFVQTSSNGESARGTLYLSRPGKLRIDYEPPTPIQVVADGQFLIYYDRSLEQVSHVPIGSTPASLLLEERIRLSDPTVAVKGLDTSGALASLTLVRSDNPGEGSLRLVFDKDPLVLRQWSVTDPQGVTTQVSLVDPQFNGKIDASLFRFADPRRTREAP